MTKLTFNELQSKINHAMITHGLTVNSLHKHYKGAVYIVKALAIDCNTNEIVVTYKPYDQQNGILFTRNLSEWIEEIEEQGGVKRFMPCKMVYVKTNVDDEPKLLGTFLVNELDQLQERQ